MSSDFPVTPPNWRRNKILLSILLFSCCYVKLVYAATTNTAPGTTERFRGGKVEWARLKHEGRYWNRHAENDKDLLRFIRTNTTLDIDEIWYAAPANDLNALIEYPFLFADSLQFLSKVERANVVEYLSRGGFLFIDACGNVKINRDPQVFLREHLAIMKEMFPKLRVEKLGPEHEVFSIYFKMTAYPPQPKPGDSWLDGPTNPLMILYDGDRIIGMLSISGIQCGWGMADRKPVPFMKMMTNIYVFAVTR